MKRRNLIRYSLLFIAGCNAKLNADNTRGQSKIISPKKLSFAVTDVAGIEDLKRDFGYFCNTLEEVLNIKIELYPVDNPTAAVPALLSGKVDIVFAGPSEYLILNARAKAVPIIAIKRKDYHSIFVVSADNKIDSLAQLKGKTVAMRKIGSTSGHLVPTKLLLDAGLDPTTNVKIVMLDDDGASALKQGKVDAWTVSSDRYKNVIESQGLSEEDFKVIFKSSLLPHDIFVASNQLTSDFITDMRSRMIQHQEKLISSMLTAKENQKYRGSELIPAKDSDYNMIREVYQKIGQDNFLKQ
ncbi:phosphate/phosphite/phosphonate ABC transporter substrate-binding protein [Anabaena subtropica]|uniref:Phosphate/phosphite/phosphonate ABC transporter substrate-binding protein n=1 Tax=Anabaena subtropica FACHB-260 TaxID=2692884 RepID=A0ABR8CS57_9NOST|nr:phosphate/phosphite/phosphonate ABC transporter substrate-binding protein [Anabaena subtropica]MBD2346026.1 phosphate/phosphite/phosphonate ABC transporter substrate-binding protein [Anabaena subtropica FACHB-260]